MGDRAEKHQRIRKCDSGLNKKKEKPLVSYIHILPRPWPLGLNRIRLPNSLLTEHVEGAALVLPRRRGRQGQRHAVRGRKPIG